MHKMKTKKTGKEKVQSNSLLTLDDSVDLSGRQMISQSLQNSINDFSDALSARDDSFHCDRRTIWGDRVSIQLIRKSGSSY